MNHTIFPLHFTIKARIRQPIQNSFLCRRAVDFISCELNHIQYDVRIGLQHLQTQRSSGRHFDIESLCVAWVDLRPYLQRGRDHIHHMYLPCADIHDRQCRNIADGIVSIFLVPLFPAAKDCPTLCSPVTLSGSSAYIYSVPSGEMLNKYYRQNDATVSESLILYSCAG
jgi:hypothetical protein